MKIIKTLKRIHPSFIGKRTDRVTSSPVIPQLTLSDGSPLPLPSLLDFDPEYVKLKMTSNANRFQDNYENFQSRTVVITRDVKIGCPRSGHFVFNKLDQGLSQMILMVIIKV